MLILKKYVNLSNKVILFEPQVDTGSDIAIVSLQYLMLLVMLRDPRDWYYTGIHSKRRRSSKSYTLKIEISTSCAQTGPMSSALSSFQAKTKPDGHLFSNQGYNQGLHVAEIFIILFLLSCRNQILMELSSNLQPSDPLKVGYTLRWHIHIRKGLVLFQSRRQQADQVYLFITNSLTRSIRIQLHSLTV